MGSMIDAHLILETWLLINWNFGSKIIQLKSKHILRKQKGEIISTFDHNPLAAKYLLNKGKMHLLWSRN